MSGGFDVEANEISLFGNYLLTQVNDDVTTIDLGAQWEGANAEGFTGLMKPAGEAMPVLQQIISESMGDLHRRVCSLGETLRTVASEYGEIDRDAEAHFQSKRARSGSNVQ